jgi:hypothetical protein
MHPNVGEVQAVALLLGSQLPLGRVFESSGLQGTHPSLSKFQAAAPLLWTHWPLGRAFESGGLRGA